MIFISVDIFEMLFNPIKFGVKTIFESQSSPWIIFQKYCLNTVLWCSISSNKLKNKTNLSNYYKWIWIGEFLFFLVFLIINWKKIQKFAIYIFKLSSFKIILHWFTLYLKNRKKNSIFDWPCVNRSKNLEKQFDRKKYFMIILPRVSGFFLKTKIEISG